MEFLKFDINKCVLCGVCVEKCPFGALTIEGKGIVVGDACRMCGLCVRNCPEKAIQFEQKAKSFDNKSVNLETVCGITSTIPDNEYNEVAFAGKSNVGKSSLINALMNRKSLARISSQPGKTQTINFYNVNDAMYLVDLPGYGYANANIEIKAKWGQMIENYLHTSKKLQAVFLLIDIRHEPSDNDIMMYDWMVNQGFAPIIIATKSDKLKKSQIAAHIKTIKDVLHVKPGTVVIPFSSMSKEGRDEIWNLIDSLVFDEDTLLAMKQEEEAKREAKSAAKRAAASQPHKKERWKKTGKPVAKKTKERRDKAKSKKSVNNHKKK